ncbi:MAG TPA: DUF4062 domain-containing protein, partial [Thermoanaerobaculia bacterium]|nr:DUF4062 domain-containing protein [Thermoanaerobaculia bacterium]
MQLGRVFISSAFRDMLDLREAAAEAVRLVGLEPVPAEHHLAQSGSVRDALEREIRHCNTYVGIFDRRRGTVPPGSGRAITEEERDPVPGHRAVATGTRATNEATGLAEKLVHSGFRRVLGMQSKISDEGATAFAEKLYAWLADGADLSQALRVGRAELLVKGEVHEWAVPTLTTRCDAGPLVAPQGSAEPVQHPFDAARGAFEVEGVSYLKEGYVGRRDVERRLRLAFESERLIAIYGLGGIGKSTLAARFLERRQAEGWRVLILAASWRR